MEPYVSLVYEWKSPAPFEQIENSMQAHKAARKATKEACKLEILASDSVQISATFVLSKRGAVANIELYMALAGTPDTLTGQYAANRPSSFGDYSRKDLQQILAPYR